MICISCNADIPPQWVAAINSNICPGCSGPIMNDQAKELLEELRGAMEKMPNDPQGLAGWLLSNYTLVKIGDAQPTNFHRKPNAQEIIQERQLKIANNPVQNFLKRTGQAKAIETNQKNFQNIVNQINSGEIDNSLYGDLNLPQEEYGEEIDSATLEAYRNQINPNNSMAKQIANNSAELIVPDTNIPPLNAEEAVNMMKTVAEANYGDSIDEDNLHPALKAARMERLRKQQELQRGGGGAFRRG